MGNKYIYNKHIAPITANARNGKGAVLFTKKFEPERTDGTTGRVISTGYTTLTDEEYRLLVESSRTFVHYKDDLKLLVANDDLPPEAKTPQEALVDARRKGREAEGRISKLEVENRKLKADLHDANEKLGQLTSATTPEEVLIPFKNKIALLEAVAEERDELKSKIASLEAAKESALIERNAAITALKTAKEKSDKKGKEFD